MDPVTGFGPDVSSEWGERGLVLIDRYVEGADPGDLDRATYALERAIEADLDHPDCGEWHYRLALCYAQLAETEPDPAGATIRYGRAIELGEVLYRSLEPDDPDRDLVALLLADCHWDRSWRVRYETDLDVADRARDVEDLLVELSAIVATGHHPTVTHYLRLLTGMAQLERYSYEPDRDVRTRLDAGLSAVAAELTWLTSAGDDTADGPVTGWTCVARLALGHGILAEAYLTRGFLDESTADADRSIAAAQAAIAWEDAERPSPLLHTHLAEAHQARWYAYTDAAGEGEPAAGATAHLDAAIDAWQVVLADGDDAWAAWNCGDLLRERAERGGSRTDAHAAVGLLRQASAEASASGDRTAWKVWRARADAEEVLARFTGDQQALAAAADSLDRALAAPDVPDDDLLSMWASRVEWERQLADGGLVRPAGPPGTGTAYRAAIEGARQAVERATGGPLVVRGFLAAMVALGEVSVLAHDSGDYDAPRMRRLLEFAAGASGDNRELASLADYGLAQLEHLEDLRHPSADGDGGAARVARVLAAGLLGSEVEHDARRLAAIAQATRKGFTGDRRRSSLHRPPGGDGGAPAPEPATGDDLAIGAYVEIMAAAQDGDAQRVQSLLQQLGPQLAALPEASVGPALARMLPHLSAAADPASAPVPELPPVPAGSGMLNGVAVAEALNRAMSALVHGVATADRVIIEGTAEYLDLLVAAVAPADARLLTAATGLAGHAWLQVARRHPLPQRPAARAAAHLQRALETAGGHQAFIWANLAIACAEATRLAQGPRWRRHSRELGHSAMRGHAWQVILQAGTDQAIAAAADAAAAARLVAGWCLDDRRHEPGVDGELVAVLDAGRGLVLQAAATSRSVADRLVAQGHPDLAREWQETGGRGRDLLTGDPFGAAGGAGPGALDVGARPRFGRRRRARRFGRRRRARRGGDPRRAAAEGAARAGRGRGDGLRTGHHRADRRGAARDRCRRPGVPGAGRGRRGGGRGRRGRRRRRRRAGVRRGDRAPPARPAGRDGRYPRRTVRPAARPHPRRGTTRRRPSRPPAGRRL